MAKQRSFTPMIGWLYDLTLWTFSVLVDLFFREVHPRGAWKVPRRGPIIFVGAPHANQFVDSLILMRVVRTEIHRRMPFLIAEKSYKRRFIGLLARATGSIPVARAMDSLKQQQGTVYLPDPVNQPTLLRGIGTKFDGPGFEKGGTVALPTVNGTSHSSNIVEINGPEELVLKKPFTHKDALYQLTGRTDISDDGKFTSNGAGVADPDFEGSKFKVAPNIDQTDVYDALFDRLNEGGCVGIFPEGGSHDRPDLLPLKAGVAIMALGALAKNPDCGVKIVPCGMNYFHAHKFRSRAVIEFGAPIEVPPELVELYKNGKRREAVGSLLETIYNSLVAVTVLSPDYETLQVVQAARRLYNPAHKKLPLPMVMELNRRLIKGYSQYKNDPRVIKLRNSVLAYNKQLRLLGVRDHQVEYAKFSIMKVVFTLIYRLVKLSVMAVGTLPGLVLFAPVFVATKMISIKKSREALAASTVKLQGRDVMATWKLLVALAFAPLLYAFYTIVATYWVYRNRVQGFVPEGVPLWLVALGGMIFFPSITFAALRFGETGMDIVKSLRPLILSLNPSSANTLHKLRVRRAQLSVEVTDLINTLGPELFPDFGSSRIIADPFMEDDAHKEGAAVTSSPRDIPRSEAIAEQEGQLPRNESFHNLANIDFFSNGSPSRSRSRSRSNSFGGLAGARGFPLKALSQVNSKDSFDEVSKRIRGAMRERGQIRRRKSEDSGWSMASDGATTPGSEEGRKDI